MASLFTHPPGPPTAPGQPAPSTFQRHHLLWALALASLAAAGAVLPLAWNLLDLLSGLPKLGWLQALLGAVPVASWLLMFVWGAAVPLALMEALHRPRGLHSALRIGGWMLLALAWYAHMPQAALCEQIYHWQTACSALRWGFSLSLGLATAAYVFLVFVLALAALELAFERNLPAR